MESGLRDALAALALPRDLDAVDDNDAHRVPDVADAEMVVAIGRAAIEMDPPLEAVALEADTLFKHAKSVSAKVAVLYDYFVARTKVEIMGASSTPSKSPRSSPQASRKLDARRLEAMKLARRVDALKMLERTLVSCKRLDQPAILEDGCVLVWNTGMPLLQLDSTDRATSPTARASPSASWTHPVTSAMPPRADTPTSQWAAPPQAHMTHAACTTSPAEGCARSSVSLPTMRARSTLSPRDARVASACGWRVAGTRRARGRSR